MCLFSFLVLVFSGRVGHLTQTSKAILNPNNDMLIIGVGNGNPLQYSCLENYMDRRVWQATVHKVAKSRTLLSDRQSNHNSVMVHSETFKNAKINS